MSDSNIFRPQEFSIDDPNNIGRPRFFSMFNYLSAIEDMISADEVQMAMYMLDNMPGWYRDNPPREALEIRKRLHKQFFTVFDYAKDPKSPEEVGWNGDPTERGTYALNICKELRANGKTPNIFEVGGGNYWLPIMLQHNELDFKYYGTHFNPAIEHRGADILGKKWNQFHQKSDEDHSIFICYEMLEHLINPGEILHHFEKYDDLYDFKTICLSTPKYCFGGGMPGWQYRALGHLRTYTPNEFIQFATKAWPTFKWSFIPSQVMILIGEKNG